MSQKTHREIKITSPALIIEDIVLSLLFVGWDDGDDGVLAVADTITTRSSER